MENSWTHAFRRIISALANENNLVQDLNWGRCVHFWRQLPLLHKRHLKSRSLYVLICTYGVKYSFLIQKFSQVFPFNTNIFHTIIWFQAFVLMNKTYLFPFICTQVYGLKSLIISVWLGFMAGISIFVSHLRLNPVYMYISNIYDLIWLGLIYF